MTWLRIIGSPARVYYRDPDDLADIAGQGAPRQLLRELGTLRSGIDGETPNVQVSLRNESGQVSALMALPPLGAAAEIRDASGVLFAGSVHDVDVSAPKEIPRAGLKRKVSMPFRENGPKSDGS